MIIPIGVDVPFDRRPFVNWLVVIGCIAVFALQIFAISTGETEAVKSYLLKGFGLKGLFGHMWLHADIFHLAGNLLFLWIFGNAVCSKIGNLMYLPVYIFLGLAAAFTYNMFSDMPMLGASGAINGVVGMYLIFFPLNDVTCFYWFYYFCNGTFSLSSYWMILLWFMYDIIGAFSDGSGVAYTAHVGGFAAGVGLATVLLLLRIVVMEDDERSLLDILGIKLPQPKPAEEWVNIPPSGPREEAIRRAAEARRLADQQEEDMIKRFEEKVPQFAYQRQEHAQDPVIAEPADDGHIRFLCECGKKLKVPGSYAGKSGKCPKCKNKVQIPG